MVEAGGPRRSAGMTSYSPTSRLGLAQAECEAAAKRRPSLTASARDVVVAGGRDEETGLRANKETLGVSPPAGPRGLRRSEEARGPTGPPGPRRCWRK